MGGEVVNNVFAGGRRHGQQAYYWTIEPKKLIITILQPSHRLYEQKSTKDGGRERTTSILYRHVIEPCIRIPYRLKYRIY